MGRISTILHVYKLIYNLKMWFRNCLMDLLLVCFCAPKLSLPVFPTSQWRCEDGLLLLMDAQREGYMHKYCME